MNNFDPKYSLLTVIMNRSNVRRVLQYAKKIGIKRFTSFHGHGTVSNNLLKFLELSDVSKEIIFFVIPTIKEDEIIASFTERFHFDKPSQGILFTVKLSHVAGITHKAPEQEAVEHRENDIVALCTIVNKGKAEDVVRIANEDAYLGGTIIPANGSIDQNHKFFDLYVEPEKEIVLMLLPVANVAVFKEKLISELELEKENSGILFTFDVNQVRGLIHKDKKTISNPGLALPEKSNYDAIWTIVPSNKDEKVVIAAQRGGSRGGTIIHARGAHVREHSMLIADIEPQREVVLIISQREHTKAVCAEISKDFLLDEPGQGILFVLPIHDPAGIYED